MAFTDFIRLQNDWAHVLLSDEWLDKVNIVTRERLILDGSQMPDETLAVETLAYLTERNGGSGVGVIVEKPELAVSLFNVPGPQGDLVITFLILEDPLTNNTGRAADQVGQKILDIGHIFTSQGDGVYTSAPNALSAARDWEPLRAFRARLRIENNRGQTDRVATPQITPGLGNVSITSPTGGAQIYFTIDGTCPAPSNMTASFYNVPFSPPSGTMIRAAAFKSGMVQSAIARKTV